MSKNRVTQDYLIEGKDQSSWELAIPNGSIYVELDRIVRQRNLKTNNKWLFDYTSDTHYSPSQFLKDSHKFNDFFRHKGLKRGDKIHLFLGPYNPIAFPIAMGIWYNGGCISLGDPSLKLQTIANQLQNADIKYICCVQDTVPLAHSALHLFGPESPKPEVIIMDVDMVENWAITESESSMGPDLVDVNNDLAAIFYSSGTTGQPKGICHTHTSFWNWTGSSTDIPTTGMLVFNLVPFSLQSGFFFALDALKRSQMSVNNFGADTMSAIIEGCPKWKPIALIIPAFLMVPLNHKLKQSSKNTERLVDLKFIVPAGAAIPDSLEDSVRQLLPNLEGIENIFGTGETGLFMSAPTCKHLGWINPKVQAKVVHIDTGKRLGPGEAGELCVKTPQFMKEYLNLPELSQALFDSEGFAHVGDMVYYDHEGRIFYLQRLKEILKYRLKHVAPTELESILITHPAVKDCMVFGKPSDEVNDLISACIVLNTDSFEANESLVDELTGFVNEQVEDFKRIRGPIIFMSELERNSFGKLQRLQTFGIIQSLL
eukprot:maker-scaffold484_size159454-snap-gene-0.19 protein:Tk04068 transcript:maker-scaffold484_size159454-snap-gene-0.19-mRNA-1 annotation:"amp dependent coa ligase"